MTSSSPSGWVDDDDVVGTADSVVLSSVATVVCKDVEEVGGGG